MTDLEVTKLCAEAMKFSACRPYGGASHRFQIAHAGFGWELYDPLHDDAQAMALVKRLRVMLRPEYSGGVYDRKLTGRWIAATNTAGLNDYQEVNADLNRAICECVAKMQAARTQLASHSPATPV